MPTRPAIAALALVAILALALPVQADYAGYMTSGLQEWVGCASSAVWNGSFVYAFGCGSIWQLDPNTDTASTVRSNFPSGAFTGSSALWTGTLGVIFTCDSANASTPRSAPIYAFTPPAGAVERAATLPLPAGSCPASAWTGALAVVFSGASIYHYDATMDALTAQGATLPAAAVSSVWDGADVLVFTADATITSYDPATGAVSVLGTLPIPGGDVNGAVWDGSAAILFTSDGMVGVTPNGTAQVLVTNTTQPVGFKPATMDASTAVVWTGTYAYSIGGEVQNHWVWYDPSPAPPGNVTANSTGPPPGSRSTGPGLNPTGSVALTWSPPDPGTHATPLTHYRVYRGPANLTPLLTANQDAWSDVAGTNTSPIGCSPLAYCLGQTSRSQVLSPTAYRTAYRASAGEAFTLLAELPADVLSYVDNLAPVDVPEYYIISAVTPEGESPWTTAIPATAGGGPLGCAQVSTSNIGVTVGAEVQTTPPGAHATLGPCSVSV